MVKPIRSNVTFQFANLGEKDKECSGEWLVTQDHLVSGGDLRSDCMLDTVTSRSTTYEKIKKKSLNYRLE